MGTEEGSFLAFRAGVRGGKGRGPATGGGHFGRDEANRVIGGPEGKRGGASR